MKQLILYMNFVLIFLVFSSFCNASESNCTRISNKSIDLLQRYHDYSHQSEELVSKTWDQLSKLRVESKKVGCEQEFLKTYLIESLRILSPETSIENYVKKKYIRGAQQHLFGENRVWKEWIRAVEKKILPLVVFLDSDLRNSLGNGWTEKAKDGDGYNVLGAYDCVSSKIYIDANLKPFDMAATFVHEIDHLYRDKTFDPGTNFTPEDLYQYVHMDEALAVLKSSYLQNQKANLDRIIFDPEERFDHASVLNSDQQIESGFHLMRQAVVWRGNGDRPTIRGLLKPQYSTGDFNLYRRDGLLNRIWLLNNPGSSFHDDGNNTGRVYLTMPYFIARAFMDMDGKFVEDGYNDSGIYGTYVKRPYDVYSTASGLNHDYDLLYKYHGFEVDTKNINRILINIIAQNYFEGDPIPLTGNKKSIKRLLLPWVLKGSLSPNDIEELSLEKSKICSMQETSEAQQVLRNYVGRKFNTAPHTHPTETGVKTEKPIRLTEHGVKPGVHIRPCMRLHEHL